jgi:ATP-dependent Clp protease adaptor protein ClpS
MTGMVQTLTAVLEPETSTRAEPRVMPLWKVLILNDEITTFEFVTDLLVSLFKKPHAEAKRLTQEVHDSGSAVVVITNLERAELYVEQVRSLARPRGFPLTATLESA